MIDTDGIVARVAAAFPAEPIPSKESLLNEHCCECVEVSEAFGYRPWPAVSLEELRAGGETALLSPAAWRYYLPAVITWCVRAPESVDVIAENLVYQLAPPQSSDQQPLREWFAERALGFTEAQRQAILTYLHWYRERQEAEYVALDMDPPEDVYRALKHWTGDVGAGVARDTG